MLLLGLIFGLLFVFEIEGLGFYIEDAYIEEINDEYFDPETTQVEVVWVNLTTSGVALNITVVKQAEAGLNGHFDLYLKSMGEYKTHSGISAHVPWCTMLSDPVLLKTLTIALGMQDLACPPPPGHYSTEYWEPSTANMPDYFPGGDYKAVFSLKLKQKVLLLTYIFVSLF